MPEMKRVDQSWQVPKIWEFNAENCGTGKVFKNRKTNSLV